MAYTSNKSNNWRVDIADSLEDMIKQASMTVSHCSNGDRPSRRESNKSWSGSDTFAGGCKIAREGWPEGRAKMTAQLDAARLISPISSHKSEALDVAGDYPLIPAYIAGDPACMVSMGDMETKAKPIVRFIVSMSVSAGISADVIINRGAGILSWIDKLENDGVRVEVVMILTSRTHSGLRYTISTYLKHADEVLEIDRLAFGLAHPSMLRRVCFGCMESNSDVWQAMGAGLGTPDNSIPKELETAHTVYFPAMHASNNDYSTVAKAVAATRKVISEGLRHDDVTRDLMDLEKSEA